ncbi:MAG: histidine kinase [Ferruginibacter sp.]|nr:histidine kinase [Ferruginibacter sp.]
MAKDGPIVIIEDDLDDRQTLTEALKDAEVWNELVFFGNSDDAYEYLKNTERHPFIILCDVNLPRQNGIEFKTELDNDPLMRSRSIPFIFYTTYVSQYAVNEAYKNLTVQGFFQKNNTYKELKDVIRIIIDYWRICRQPIHPERKVAVKDEKSANE